MGFGTSDWYAGAQVRAATPLYSRGRTMIDAGGGFWGASQRTFGDTASRFDVGPSMRMVVRPFPFFAQIDYRVRAAGNAQPGSGLAVTVAGQL